nr:hypothetical protein [Lachnospira multipara]
MAQLYFTLDYDFFVGLFSETKDEAFGKLMEALLNQVLLAESSEQLAAELRDMFNSATVEEARRLKSRQFYSPKR